MRTTMMILAGLAVFATSAVASAQTALPLPAERPGRYAMQPVEGGFARLDTETGAVSLCTKKGTGFSCDAVADERGLQKEIDRLNAENRELHAELKRLAEQQSHGREGKRMELPSEEDVDKALNYMERLVKKFRDKMKELEGNGSGKGTPL